MPIDTLWKKNRKKDYSANKIIHINSNRKKCVSPYFMRKCWNARWCVSMVLLRAACEYDDFRCWSEWERGKERESARLGIRATFGFTPANECANIPNMNWPSLVYIRFRFVRVLFPYLLCLSIWLFMARCCFECLFVFRLSIYFYLYFFFLFSCDYCCCFVIFFLLFRPSIY